MRRQKYLCAWTSGHTPPKAVYYRETETGWGCTYDRAEAKRFPTRAAAWAAWKSKHVRPEQYQAAIDAGRIRVESENAPCFCFQ